MAFAISDADLRRYIVRGILTDTRFLTHLAAWLHPQDFPLPEEQWILTTALAYHAQHGQAPGVEAAAMELARAGAAGTVDAATTQSIVQYWNALPVVTPKNQHLLDYAFRRAGEYLRIEAFKRVVGTAERQINAGRIATCVAEMEATLRIGATAEIRTVAVTAEAGTWVTEMAAQPQGLFGIGLASLDKDTNGGLRPGELGTIMAPVGRGKSHTLIHIGALAARQGHYVLHVTLEMGLRTTLARYAANFAGLHNPGLYADVPGTIAALTAARPPGDVIVSHISTRGISPQGLRGLLGRVRASGIDPRLLIVDYADLLAPDRAGSKDYLTAEYLYEDLRALATIENVAVWTATQTGRQALAKDDIDIDDIADSFGKAKVADIILAMAQSDRQLAHNRAKVKAVKVRDGLAQREVRIVQDWAHSRIHEAATATDGTGRAFTTPDDAMLARLTPVMDPLPPTGVTPR